MKAMDTAYGGRSSCTARFLINWGKKEAVRLSANTAKNNRDEAFADSCVEWSAAETW